MAGLPTAAKAVILASDSHKAISSRNNNVQEDCNEDEDALVDADSIFINQVIIALLSSRTCIMLWECKIQTLLHHTH